MGENQELTGNFEKSRLRRFVYLKSQPQCTCVDHAKYNVASLISDRCLLFQMQKGTFATDVLVKHKTNVAVSFGDAILQFLHDHHSLRPAEETSSQYLTCHALPA